MSRVKMSREMRAKQFMPFAALKGYSDTLKRKEKVIVPQKEFFEEYQEEIDWKLKHISKNDIVTVVYFKKGEYITTTGMVSEIDTRFLTIVKEKIPIGNIFKIESE